jgi:hypothetical protein
MTGSFSLLSARVGLIRVREHCNFTWRELEEGGPRHAEVLPTHCKECIEVLRQQGMQLIFLGPRPAENG